MAKLATLTTATDNELLGRIAEETVDRRRAQEVVIGKLSGFDPSGNALVEFPGNASRSPIPARSTVPLKESDVGRELALLFESGDPEKPIVMGPLRSAQEPAEHGSQPLSAKLDGDRVVLSAEKEIELRCGKASLILTRAGKILLRGAYLLSRSSGVNRIKGGSVQIN